MDFRTIVAWIQLGIGAIFIQRTIGHWRAGRGAWTDAIIPALISSALGVQMLTSGLAHDTAGVIAGVGTAIAVARMFIVRDRFGLWSNVVFCAFALPIVLVELRFDDLTGWQGALFAGVGAVFATLMVVTIVRLRSYKRVALPSA